MGPLLRALPRLVVWMFSVGMMVLGVDVVSGQNYPNYPSPWQVSIK